MKKLKHTVLAIFSQPGAFSLLLLQWVGATVRILSIIIRPVCYEQITDTQQDTEREEGVKELAKPREAHGCSDGWGRRVGQRQTKYRRGQ